MFYKDGEETGEIKHITTTISEPDNSGKYSAIISVIYKENNSFHKIDIVFHL